MKSVVTNRQMFFMLILIVTGYSFISIPKEAFMAAGTGGWFSILLLSIVFAFGTYFISSLNKIFEGKTIFEYSKLLVGKFFGNGLCLIYLIYFSLVSVLLTRNIIEFINECYLPLTPIWALLFLILFVCLYIGYKGNMNIGRLCEIYGISLVVVAFCIHTVMFMLGDITYIQPFFEVSKVKDYVFGMKDLIVAFFGFEILTIIPFGKENSKKGVLTCVLATLFIGLFYIVVVEASTMIIGPSTVVYYDNALIEALRETHLPSTFFLERVDFLFLIFGIAGIIGGLSLLFCTTSEFISKFFTKIRRDNLFLGMGIILFVVCNFFISYQTSLSLFKKVLPIFGIITMFVIPIFLFVIAKVKKYGK